MFSTLANWLFGCSHRHTSFPMTWRAERGSEPHRKPETYVVCLECGARMAYDWTLMRVAKQPVGTDQSIRAQREGRAPGMAVPTANRWLERLVHHT